MDFLDTRGAFVRHADVHIGLAQALTRYGADVYLQPTHVDAPLPKDVANLLTKELDAPFDLYINHIDPSQLTCDDEIKRNVLGLRD